MDNILLLKMLQVNLTIQIYLESKEKIFKSLETINKVLECKDKEINEADTFKEDHMEEDNFDEIMIYFVYM